MGDKSERPDSLYDNCVSNTVAFVATTVTMAKALDANRGRVAIRFALAPGGTVGNSTYLCIGPRSGTTVTSIGCIGIGQPCITITKADVGDLIGEELYVSSNAANLNVQVTELYRQY